MEQKVELSAYDLDLIKLALKKSIDVNNRNLEKVGSYNDPSFTSPQNEAMQELLNRLEKLELFK